MPPRLANSLYTVGWICAIPIELAAARGVLDQLHEQYESEDCIFTLGSIASHNIVIACLPAGQMGISPAATVASKTRSAFPKIRFGLMVGIGGGVPGKNPKAKNSVRLGDVVVGHPQGTFGGVIQYDYGKATMEGFERTGQLNSPPLILLSAIAMMKSKELSGESDLHRHIAQLENLPRKTLFRRSHTTEDILFSPQYNHPSDEPTCENCLRDMAIQRTKREQSHEIIVHYGNIASGNQVIKNAYERDRISAMLGGVLCLEMEAAGLMNHFECIVIRGICDYADSHKNKTWQPYAAATAAAYAKELLYTIPVRRIETLPTVNEPLVRSATPMHQQPQTTQNTGNSRGHFSPQPESRKKTASAAHIQPRRSLPFAGDKPDSPSHNLPNETAALPRLKHSENGQTHLEGSICADLKPQTNSSRHQGAILEPTDLDNTHKTATRIEYAEEKLSSSLRKDTKVVQKDGYRQNEISKDSTIGSPKQSDSLKSASKGNDKIQYDPALEHQGISLPQLRSKTQTGSPQVTRVERLGSSSLLTNKSSSKPNSGTKSSSVNTQQQHQSKTSPSGRKIPTLRAKDWVTPERLLRAVKSDSKFVQKLSSLNPKISKKVSKALILDIPEILLYLLQSGLDPQNTSYISYDRQEMLMNPHMWILSDKWKSVGLDARHLILKYLSDHGADLANYRIECGITALHQVAWLGNINIFSLIRQRGADINSRVTALSREKRGSYEGDTPLMIAVKRNHLSLVEYCLGLTNSKHQVSKEGQIFVPSFWLAHYPTNEQRLVDIESKNYRSGETALSQAVKNWEVHPYSSLNTAYKIIGCLLRHGANHNAADSSGETALHVVAGKGFEPIVRLLLQYGADVNVCDSSLGLLPIEMAIEKNHRAIVRRILDTGRQTTTMCKKARNYARLKEKGEIETMLQKEILRLRSQK